MRGESANDLFFDNANRKLFETSTGSSYRYEQYHIREKKKLTRQKTFAWRLKIGKLGGANVEICEEVRAENFILFGLTNERVEKLQQDDFRSLVCLEKDSRWRLSI